MFRDHIRKLRPVQESYKPPVDKLQLFFEQKGLDIATLKKEHPTSGKLRLHILIDVINDKTPIDTKVGKTSISWINNADKVALESGDMITSFLLGKRYKQVFVSDTGKKLRLNDLIKTDMFGGGRGSGGGAEQTALMECAQCVYAAAIFGGERLGVGDELDSSEWGKYANSFDVDRSLEDIENAFTQPWHDSSILIANEMKKNLRGDFVFHRGSSFVDEINNKFKILNNQEKPKPFSDINKWSPADIYAVKRGARIDLNKFSSLGEFTNELKELYDKQDLVGISLKMAAGRVSTEEKNTTGFIRRPVRYGGFIKQTNFFNSKDFYIFLNKQKMQLRTFAEASGWQGEGKGAGAAAGKIGGGVLEAIMVKNSTLIKFPYTNVQLKSLAKRPTPTFLNEMYDYYVGLSTGKVLDRQDWIKQASANRIGKVSGTDWRFSKYRGMFFVSQLESNKMTANKIVDQIAAYSLSATNDSAPHVVYK